MRRFLTATTAVLLCAVSFTGCAKAKELVTSAGCSGLDSAVNALPAADSLSESTIKGLASAAGAVDKALKAIPKDKVPAAVQSQVDGAITSIDEAVNNFSSDPTAAKAAAAKGIDALKSAITDTKGKLGC
jgi:hypothetical protein